MAIIPEHPYLTVDVLVSGQVTQEYAQDEDSAKREAPVAGPPSNICYIESKSGQTFSVRITVDPRRQVSKRNALSFHVYVDGIPIEGRVLHRPQSTPWVYTATGPIERSEASGNEIQWDLSFASISTVEEASKESRISNSLGTIQVKVSTCLAGRRYRHQSQRLFHNADLTFPEKAMKGRTVSHGTIFSHGKLVQTHGYRQTRDIVPVANFYFRYRSRIALQQELIIPRTPSPELSSGSAKIDSLSANEIRNLAEQMLSIKRDQDVKKEEAKSSSHRQFINLVDDEVIEVSRHPCFPRVKGEDDLLVVDLTGEPS